QNPCFVQPDDLTALGLHDGDVVDITSDHGRVTAVVASDPTLRRGVVSMTHAHGRVGPATARDAGADDPRVLGTHPGRLLSGPDDRQPISLMPRLSAVPVTITRAPSTSVPMTEELMP